MQDLNGIDRLLLKQHAAQPFKHVWQHFLQWLNALQQQHSSSSSSKAGIVLVAHNAAFDEGMLAAEAARAGYGRFALADAGVVAVVNTLSLLQHP